MGFISSMPWEHGLLWTLTLFCLFLHSQVVIMGGIIGWQSFRSGSLKATRDTLFMASISLLFILLQAKWIQEGYTVEHIRVISDLGWRVFDCMVGVALIRHMSVRRCYICSYWGKGRLAK